MASMPPITSALLGLGSILTIVTLWLWNGSRGIRSNYTDDFDEMMTYYASQFRSELNDIVLIILAEVDGLDRRIKERPTGMKTDGGDSVPLEMETMDAIERVIERDELEDIENALRDFDKPMNLYEEVKDYYGSAWTQFGGAAVATVVIALSTVVFPNNETIRGLELLLGMPLVIWVIGGIRKLKWAWDAERELDDLIDDYSTNY